MGVGRSSVSRIGRVRVLVAVAVLASSLAVLTTREPAAAVSLPAGVPGWDRLQRATEPTALRSSPDGRVFVAEKSAVIKVLDSLSDTTPTVFADLRTQVHNFWDRGLLDVGLNGAILRVDPATGAGLPDNSMASSGDPNARRIVAYGLRNPFRMTTRPATNEVWIGDVGWSEWEEIDVWSLCHRHAGRGRHVEGRRRHHVLGPRHRSPAGHARGRHAHVVARSAALPSTCHDHPLQTWTGAAGGSFVAPDHEYPHISSCG
jgi:Glucose / Sorbosone dehydrogenase